MKRNGFTLIEVLIVIAIIGILVAIVAGAYNADEQEQPPSAVEVLKERSAVEVLKERGRQHKETMRGIEQEYRDSQKATPNISVDEDCINGFTYLFITKDGKDWPPAPKENRYGDNERCAE